MSETEFCKTCRKPKAPFVCGLCECHTCKSCAHFLGEDSFSYLKVVPKDLKHTIYCGQCFADKISDTYNEYQDNLEKAKNIIIYSKDQSKLTRFLKRKQDPYVVEDCEDEQEAIMRMSFFAVQENYNALIDIVIKHKKIIVGSHKKTVYSGTAVPITIDPDSIRGHYEPP